MNLASALLIAWIRTCAAHYGVDPEFAQAVAIVESRPAGGGMEMRCGPLGRAGKYYGPMGINRCFKSKWPIDNPFVNVEVGVKALRGNDMRRVLKRYNASFTEAYFRTICKIQKQLKKENRS